MEKLAKYKYRIGAWITATSFHNAVRSYINHHLSNQISDESKPLASTSVPVASIAETASAANLLTSSTAAPAEAAVDELKIERITIKSKTEDIQSLPNNILLIQVLDVLIQKGLKPGAETLDLIKMNIGPHDESNLVYQKFQYLADKVNQMNELI